MNRKVEKINSAIFLDRDGTIIEDLGYIKDPIHVKFFKQTIPSLRSLSRYFYLYIVTNQSGIAKGLITYQDVVRVNAHILSVLANAGIHIMEVYICPHDRADNCRCIKPNPFYLKKAEKEHGIDLKRSFVIGDHPGDVYLAKNAGAKGIYLLSGHGKKHLEEIDKKIVVANDIEEATNIILNELKLEK
jgi:histidinol-phosphate phosphatase family protein